MYLENTVTSQLPRSYDPGIPNVMPMDTIVPTDIFSWCLSNVFRNWMGPGRPFAQNDFSWATGHLIGRADF